MKLNHLLSFCIVLLFASCSQQKFAFRHTVHVKNNQPTTTDVVEQKHTSTLLNARNMSFSNAVTSVPTKMEFSHTKGVTHSITINKPTTLLTDSLKKKYKFDTDEPTSKDDDDNTKSSKSKYVDRDKADQQAVTGFILGLLSLFLLFTSIPGFIYSIKGLKSRKNKTLAIIGLVLSSFFVAILAFYLLLFILFFLIIGGS